MPVPVCSGVHHEYPHGALVSHVRTHFGRTSCRRIDGAWHRRCPYSVAAVSSGCTAGLACQRMGVAGRTRTGGRVSFSAVLCRDPCMGLDAPAKTFPLSLHSEQVPGAPGVGFARTSSRVADLLGRLCWRRTSPPRGTTGLRYARNCSASNASSITEKAWPQPSRSPRVLPSSAPCAGVLLTTRRRC